MDISTPYNTIHVTHVGFDSETGEFTGLPREWHILLNQSGITKQEQEKNPQAVIDAIEFFQGTQQTMDDAVFLKIPKTSSSLSQSPSIISKDSNESRTSKTLRRFSTLRITKTGSKASAPNPHLVYKYLLVFSSIVFILSTYFIYF
ncbi:PBD-domain-containing protein [Backusella circina FSU 941]|nr:PBD-domain-containing protein [Backusella circina FSU 941]